MKLAFSTLFLFIIASCTLTITAQEKLNKIIEAGVINVGMTGTQPPFCMPSKTNNKLVGFEVDLAEVLAEYMNVELNIVKMPFTELLPALKQGKIDVIMSGLTFTATRNLDVSFIGPFVVSGKSILTSYLLLPKFNEVKKAKDLNAPSFRLAALEGSTSEDFINRLAKRATYTPVKNYEDAIKMIVSGDLDGLVADYPSCSLFKNTHAEDKLDVLEEALTVESIGMAIPANDPQMLNFMQNFYNTMLMSGYLEDLKYNWFEDGNWLQKVELNSIIEKK